MARNATPTDTLPAEVQQEVTETPTGKSRKRAPEVPFVPVQFDPAEFVERDPEPVGKRRSPYMEGLILLVEDSLKNDQPKAVECDGDQELVGALETKIRSAGNAAKCGIRFGGYQKSPNEGKVYVTFKAVPRVSRPRKPKTTTPVD